MQVCYAIWMGFCEKNLLVAYVRPRQHGLPHGVVPVGRPAPATGAVAPATPLGSSSSAPSILAIVVCTSLIGQVSVFRRRSWWCFSASNRWAISLECFLNFIFRYCCKSMAVAGGNVDNVFSICSASDISTPQIRSWTIIRCSSELNAEKFEKSSTRMFVQSVRAWDRKRVC